MQGRHAAAPRRARARCAAPTPGWPTRRSSTTCSRLGVTDGRAAARPRVHVRAAPRAARPDATTGATTRSGFFAPHAAYAAATDPQERRRRVQGDGQDACTPPASRSSSTSSTTTPPRGRDGPTPVLARAGRRDLLPARRARRRHRRRPAAATPSTCGDADASSQLVLDSLRYWVNEMPRRRVPLRPRRRRSPAAADDDFDPNHPFLVALRTDPVLSPGRSSSPSRGTSASHGWRTGQFPPPFARVERPVPRRRPRRSGCPTWPAAPETAATASGTWPPGWRVAGPVRRPGPRAARRRSTSSPRTTASPSRDLTAYDEQAQRGQRRGQPRRHDDNRSWNHGVEGADRRPGDPGRAPPAPCATSSPPCCSRPACR